MRAGSKAIRYRLHHKSGLINLIHDVNGYINHPVRYHQLSRLCRHYDILLKDQVSITKNSNWFSGLFDSDGSIS